MPAELWIPEVAREKIAVCFMCGDRFPERQREEWAKHVAKCADRNEDRLEAAEAARKSSAFTSIYDEEQFRFLRERAAKRGEL